MAKRGIGTGDDDKDARQLSCSLAPHAVRLPLRGGGASGPTEGARRDLTRKPGVPRASVGATPTLGARSHTLHGLRCKADPGGEGHAFLPDRPAARGTPPPPGGTVARGRWTHDGARAHLELRPHPDRRPPPHQHLWHATLACPFSSEHCSLLWAAGEDGTARHKARLPPAPSACRWTSRGA